MKKFFFFLTALFAGVVWGNAQNTSPYWSLAGNNNASPSSKLGTTNDISLRFYTKNIQRMIINSAAGLVGIGTPAPNSKLHVNSIAGEHAFRAQVNGITKFLVHLNGGVVVGGFLAPPVDGLYVTGRTGIGTSKPTQKLHVVGNGLISDSLIAGSLTAGSANKSVGVKGTGSNYGVFGSSTYLGVYGNSSYTGVYGEGGSYGVYGYSSGNNGVGGFSSTGKGVYGSGNWGVYGSSSNYGVYGNSSYVGVYGNGTSYGVSGTGSYGLSGTGSYIGVFGTSTDGTAVVGNCTNGTGGNFFSNNGYGLVAGTGRGDKNWAGVFNGNLYAYGAYQSSDRKLKENIEELGDAMSIITRLKPKSYEFQKEGKLALLNLPSGRHYGLIAQDVELVLPDLVKESVHDLNFAKTKVVNPLPDRREQATALTEPEQKHTIENITIKAVNYIELIPIIVKGMQELYADKDKKINDLQLQIDELKSMIQNLSKQAGNNTTGLSSAAFLKQNVPNPAGNNTVISYYIPDNAGYAQIKITDMKGRVMKSFNAAKGEGQINIRTGELPSGTYNYTLYINNKPADTKQMVLHK